MAKRTEEGTTYYIIGYENTPHYHEECEPHPTYGCTGSNHCKYPTIDVARKRAARMLQGKPNQRVVIYQAIEIVELPTPDLEITSLVPQRRVR